MPPLVSILIPAYNAEQWLAETLESALAQTWQNREIIVVDDGSSDHTLAIARTFAAPQVKVINQSNRGASAARNCALHHAQGDFIQYLDADDLLAPNKIELQVQQLQDGNLGWVAAGEWARFYHHPAEATFTPQPPWADLPPVDWLMCVWEGHWMMHPAAWLIPRTIAHQAGLWDERLSLNDDGEYFCRVVLASQGIKFCWGARSYYRSGNSSSLSGSKSRSAWESALLTLELQTQHLLTKEDSPRTRRICATVFQRLIYELYPDFPDLQHRAEALVEQFGGADLKPTGGPLFQLLAAQFGWQKAKQIQRWVYQYGYGKAAIGWKLSKLKAKAAVNLGR
ncbi:glycosyltransferase family 2 protein [Kovacikia minuta CCNUW1]|uniref:glycosyltransferase family 2 protein n=1 Tax=Kovacikia minuta TaxID=2931930 RepID=UPI001CCCC9E4|nr:glycosyltransferase family A protein [Kovacikia minuta]UBF28983.1 glycosyltransferase family 2 protein [Kovacikia minuta CCNUW1]